MKLKRILAVAMATTMVMAMSITALADDPEPDNTSTGAGASEGHVEEKLTNVVIPTVATGASSPFRYTMDPERLISQTAAGKYTDVIYPSSSDDKGVYFNNGAGTGENASKTIFASSSLKTKVTNKSSHDVALTVTAEAVATEGGTDIPLVAQTALASATDASLYLGLVVGTGEGSTVAVASGTPAAKTVTLAGKPANFTIAVKTSGDTKTYEYREKTLEEWQAITGNGSKTATDYENDWSNVEFSLEGETTSGKKITSTTTAPSLKVTWSWVDPTAAPAATPASMSTTAKSAVISNLDPEATLSSVKVVKIDDSVITLTATTQYTFTNSTFAIVTGKEVLLDNTKYKKYILTFSDDTVIEIPIVAAE